MIGDYNWGNKSKGEMNVFSKMKFAYDVILLRYEYKKQKKVNFDYNQKDLNIPDSALIKQTIEFLKDTHQVYLINHCFRTYLFGYSIGRNENIKFDLEIFTIASLLHDVGLTSQHQLNNKNCNCFAVEGAIEAGNFLEKQNIEKDKIKTIQDVIALHLNIKIPINLPEAYLLNKGASVDVIGRNLNSFNPEFLTKTLETYPRLNFKTEIDKVLTTQCNIRPNSRIAFLYENGFNTLIQKSDFDE